MCYHSVLLELAKKIEAIEEHDSNFRQNVKWIKYRRQQDEIYCILKKNKEVQDERCI